MRMQFKIFKSFGLDMDFIVEGCTAMKQLPCSNLNPEP